MNKLPGLLQTEEYAEAIMRKVANISIPTDRDRTGIEIQLARQHLLEQPAPPTLMYVLDEAAIQRLVGERNIAHGQIDRLINLATRPNITIEVVPFTAGLHRGMMEHFIIL